MVNFVAMRLLGTNGELTPAAQLLLSAVSGVEAALLEVVRVFPKERNWLRFPWYAAAKGGGAFVMGDRIYAHQRFFAPDKAVPFLYLLAHEVGHLPHAAPFGYGSVGKARFVLWAAGHYLRSAIRHGRHAHRLARIEQEADRGRWVLTELMRATATDPPLYHLNDATAMRQWLHAHRELINTLHRKYPGWPLP